MADVVEECVVHSELLVFIARNQVLQTHMYQISNAACLEQQPYPPVIRLMCIFTKGHFISNDHMMPRASESANISVRSLISTLLV